MSACNAVRSVDVPDHELLAVFCDLPVEHSGEHRAVLGDVTVCWPNEKVAVS